MRVSRRVGAAVGVVAFMVVITSSPASAALAITVPTAVNLGSVATGSTSLSHHLGTVTVTATGLAFPSFTATVSTTAFTTGAGGPARTIPAASISYWSGPATAALLQNATPGQAGAAQAQALSVPLTAFSSAGLALSITTAWDPTIVVAIPAAAVAGIYTGTITHSVA